MTAKTDLLPLPPLWICPNVEPADFPEVAKALIDYARANVAHATAPLQAEIEALRAERDAAFRMSRCECASDECCANLVKHQLRAERLVEALRRYGVHDQECVEENIPICTCGLDAALEQEKGRG